MARTKAKPYTGFLAKPRKLSAAERKRAAGLPMTPPERLDAEHDTHGHWGLIYEELCAEYGLDFAQASMKVLWMRMARRHVPAARDLALPGQVGRSPEEGAAQIDSELRRTAAGSPDRREAARRIAERELSDGNPSARMPPRAIRDRARQIMRAHAQRERRRRQNPT